MAVTPEDLRYTEEHEWVRRIGPTRVRVGITDYAQSQLGDVVYVQLPDEQREAAAGESIAEVESTKSVSDIYAPLAAKVVAVNEELSNAPETLNADPYGAGWLFELEVADAAALDVTLGELLDAAGYQGVIGG
ncbi:glycine cleavage system protein GcvH [Nocardia farcinica]|uniref:Glycine cleavage system H protein n=3 Tax=Nocardia TaxID=1817 RepID=GCSH_NOCFA|nr:MULTISPECIES: glycine cleavage system protein GcvH [Nocardia]Q5YWV9.1 RecName: Full=Glycine cleavage system H protein [Nocardia farcinica IFM 10152]AXK84995.1 glycine cleavage system protein GcvH [Nocardia farcinica]MBA4855387.1 glycine cleavage system protein GcvH [Nocardia farcinica]MBC9818274.1 glycine cleavage system protein GcvH [Nocardia farcinica]MBF6067678.1 glycine cleavage system protein GcvH [Nocardia farcinica]MBF6140943.1 glycine cleavage system protein GcvH [Nocardia farcinic